MIVMNDSVFVSCFIATKAIARLIPEINPNTSPVFKKESSCGFKIRMIPTNPIAMPNHTFLSTFVLSHIIAISGMKIGVVLFRRVAFTNGIFEVAITKQRNANIPVNPRVRCRKGLVVFISLNLFFEASARVMIRLVKYCMNTIHCRGVLYSCDNFTNTPTAARKKNAASAISTPKKIFSSLFSIVQDKKIDSHFH